MTYRPDIDGLRGIAVLLVVAFHAFPTVLPFGFLGVDVFFVISGYLITGDILRRRQAGTFTLADFYARRVRRLFPALITVLAATVAFGSIVLYPDELEQLRRHVLASALFAQNFQLLGEVGYWDADATTKPLLHLWSLAVEEQFYLLWPLVLAMRPKRWMVVLLALASLGAFVALPLDLAYYLSITRFWEILAGAVLAFTGWFPRMPTTRALVYVGLISYPLYLWHWPVLVYLRMLVPDAGVAWTLGAVALSFCLAAFTYRWIERPIRSGGNIRAKVRGLAVGMVAAVLASSATAMIRQPADQRFADLAEEADRSRMRSCSLPGGVCLTTTDRPTIALVGDSHADHLFNALASNGWMLSYRQSCPPLLGQDVVWKHSHCRSEALVQALVGHPTVQTVVLSFYGGYSEAVTYAADHNPGSPSATEVEGPGADRSERVRKGLSATVGALTKAGKQVVLMLDVPELPFRPRECITRPLQTARPCAVSRAAVLERQANMRAIVADVQREHPALRVFDPINVLCDASACRIDRDGLLYRDSHHLTLRGSRIVAREFVWWLNPHGASLHRAFNARLASE